MTRDEFEPGWRGLPHEQQEDARDFYRDRRTPEKKWYAVPTDFGVYETQTGEKPQPCWKKRRR